MNLSDLIAHTDSHIYLFCRALQHAWDEQSSRVERSGSRLLWSHDCDRCGTIRTRHLTLDGYIDRTTYSYPPGYLIQAPNVEKGGLDQAGRAGLRLHLIQGE